MVESISFDDPELEDNGFLTFFVENDDVIVQKHLWDNTSFVHKETKSKSQVISLNTKSVNGAELNIDFYNKLNDIGAGFNHINKETILLNDVFVYPNIEVDSEEKKLKRKR